MNARLRKLLLVNCCALASLFAVQFSVAETLQVYAAASLGKVFPAINKEVFQPTHPDVKVAFSFLGSNTLVEQIKNGAPADVFASADLRNMRKGVDAGVVDKPRPFAANVLALIVPTGNPGHITGLDDSLKGKKLVICTVEVPCGSAAKKLAAQKGIELKPVSLEQKVTDVRGKVESGEADAGLVFTTDAKNSGNKVEVISVPGAEKIVTVYPIATVKDSKQKKLAEDFINAVLSPEGMKILADYGFQKPLQKDTLD